MFSAFNVSKESTSPPHKKPNKRKYMTYLRKILIGALAIATISSSLMAAPAVPRDNQNNRWTTQQRIQTESDFAELEVGDKVAKVCKKCDDVSVHTVKSKAEAMELCEDGAMIECNVCGHEAKTINRRSASSGNAGRRILFLDKDGEECMYMIKLG